MKKFLIFAILIIAVVVAALIFDQKRFMSEKDFQQENLPVRKPAVAGTFYSANKVELSKNVKQFLSEVKLPTLKERVRGLIVPHAGYQFSGRVAAYGYKAIEGQEIDTVILIGNSHKELFEGASVYSKGYYQTPLGKIKINQDKAKQIIKSSNKISFKEKVHQDEHSLEVQLPFLQTVFSAQGRPAAGWKIIPIIIGSQSDIVDDLVNAINKIIDKKTLIIVSSDLSHYPNYEDAKHSDNKVIKAILTGNIENLKQTISDLEKENIENLQTCACAQESIEVLMKLMGESKAKLLKYANSGDTSVGDKSQVVGYSAIMFSNEEQQDFIKDELEIEFTDPEKEKLLQIAKSTVNSYVLRKEIFQPINQFTKLEKHLGAFVTLKKYGQLRGCIGTFEPNKPLYQVIRDMSISASSEDPRFSKVSEDELDELEYEISVLSPLKKVDNWEEVKVGKHGVKIVSGLRSGVFLPQVATDNNWDRETFLSVLCQQKAGLSAYCYKNKNTDIYIFTAKVFSDKEVFSKSLSD